jgi:L-lactate utilization protein LutB
VDHLEGYLEQAEAALRKNGVEVYFAETVDRACDMAYSVMEREKVHTVVKSKSMPRCSVWWQ